jgi:polyferredoxin
MYCNNCRATVLSRLPRLAQVVYKFGYVLLGLVLTPLLVVAFWGNIAAYIGILGALAVVNAGFLSVMHSLTNKKTTAIPGD